MKEIYIKVKENSKLHTEFDLKDAILINITNFRIKRIIRLIRKIKFEPNTSYKLDISLPTILERRTPLHIFGLIKIFGSKFVSSSSLSTYIEYNWLNNKNLNFLETKGLILSRNYTTFRDVEILLRFLRSFGFTHINLDLELKSIQARLYRFNKSITASI